RTRLQAKDDVGQFSRSQLESSVLSGVTFQLYAQGSGTARQIAGAPGSVDACHELLLAVGPSHRDARAWQRLRRLSVDDSPAQAGRGRREIVAKPYARG